MVRPREDPWGLSPSLRPWEAWGSLMDVCGRFRPVGPPRSTCDAYVGRVCHCHCGGDRRSRHPVRLVWVNGSLGCRTIVAMTRDFILDTIHDYKHLQCHTCLTMSCNGQPDPKPACSVRCDPPPPSWDGPGYPLPCLGVIEPPPRVCSKEGGEAVPRTYGPWPRGL